MNAFSVIKIAKPVKDQLAKIAYHVTKVTIYNLLSVWSVMIIARPVMDLINQTVLAALIQWNNSRANVNARMVITLIYKMLSVKIVIQHVLLVIHQQVLNVIVVSQKQIWN